MRREDADVSERPEVAVAGSAVIVNERRRGFSWRSFGSFVLILLAALLVPVSVFFGWARADLIHEQDFVDTFAPLAVDPVVQAEVTDAVVETLNEHVDVDAKVDLLFAGIEELGLSDEASEALDVLREPVASGTVSVLHDGVEAFVQSDMFANTWENALRVSHRALVATVTMGEAPGAIEIDRDGNVQVEVGYVVEEVKNQLISEGVQVAEDIPTVTATVIIGQSDALAFTGVAYRAVSAIGFWVPVVTFILLSGGVLLARNRGAGFIGLGVAFIVGGLTTMLGLAVGLGFAQKAAMRSDLAPAAVVAAYEDVVQKLFSVSEALLLLGFLAILLPILIAAPSVRDWFFRANARLAQILGLGAQSTQWQARLRRFEPLLSVALVVVATILLLVLPIHIWAMIAIVTGLFLIWWLVMVLGTPDSNIGRLGSEPQLSDERS